MRSDAIVVGGGHNGLVAAHYLACHGLDVVVLERRNVVGGLCGPVEFFPGYRGAVTNSPGSLEPRIVQDMRLESFGLAFDKPDPTVVVPFPGARAFVGWRDSRKVHEGMRRFSAHDADAYHEVIGFFNDFARRMQVSMFEPPPTFAEVVSRFTTPADEADLAAVLFGSIRDFLDDRLESDEMKAVLAMLALAGGNGGPSTPGSCMGLLYRPLSLASMSIEAEHDPRQQPLRGSTGLPRGGMGSVGEAMERSIRAAGVTVRTDCAVTQITADAAGRVTGVVLDDGREFEAPIVLSNLNPKTTLLDLVEPANVDAALRERLQRRKMDGGAFKLALALDGIPRFAAAPSDQVRGYAACQFRIAPSMDYLDRAYDDYKYGRPSRQPELWGLTPSVMDPSMAPPGRHLMSVNAWYAPYHLRDGDWAQERDAFARRCIDTLAEFIPNIREIITDIRCFSPRDLEREFGLVEGNQIHGDMGPGGMFSFRPVPGVARYRTPVAGLYLCGSGAWPGGFVTGVPGHNAAQTALRDRMEPRSAEALLEGSAAIE